MMACRISLLSLPRPYYGSLSLAKMDCLTALITVSQEGPLPLRAQRNVAHGCERVQKER